MCCETVQYLLHQHREKRALSWIVAFIGGFSERHATYHFLIDLRTTLDPRQKPQESVLLSLRDYEREQAEALSYFLTKVGTDEGRSVLGDVRSMPASTYLAACKVLHEKGPELLRKLTAAADNEKQFRALAGIELD